MRATNSNIAPPGQESDKACRLVADHPNSSRPEDQSLGPVLGWENMPAASPSASADQIVARDHAYVVRNYGRYPLVVSRGEGVRLVGADGRRYLDFMSGIGVMALGHSHPAVIAVIRDQLGTLMHCSNLYYHSLQGEVAEQLAALSGLQRAFFCNSGAEAVEAALKIAKGHGRAIDRAKTEIVALENSFGGRTLGAIAVTGQPKYREPFEPLIPGVRFVPPNDVAALESAVGERTAGIIFEPILGEGGIIEVSEEFARAARTLATESESLLICDEIQSGLGRTGERFAYHHWGEDYLPDVVTVAKPMGAGLPIGAVVCSESASRALGPGMHGSTFGGGALACRVAREFLGMLPDLIPRVKEVSAYFRGRLSALADRHGFVSGLRGRGLMVGVELTVPGGGFVPMAQEAGLLINCTAGNVLRMLPPFIITRKHADEAVGILDSIFQKGVPE